MDIILKNIRKSFSGEIVLNDFSSTIRENEFTCIMGESGIGKTTLINIIMGIVEPDSGEILGMDERKIGVVFQEDRLCENYNCITNLKLVCNKNIKEKEIIDLLVDLGLKEVIQKKASILSGGMRRRLAIGRALISESDILIMDEPFKGLDKELYLRIISYVKEQLSGKTVIVVTHRDEECKLLGANKILL